MIDANGNVAYDATSDSVFADASWSWFDEVRDRRVLRRPPEQRQHLEREREHDEPRRGCRRTGSKREQRRSADVAPRP